MIEYIYIVKCPGCEDEMFNFFTDARMQCDLLMSKKPSITQVEVERNDFGECTDSHDLGTVWSWEEAMKDTEGGYTEAEPAKTLFTKDDLKLMADGKDPEFDNLDNSVDCEIDEISEKKPIEEDLISSYEYTHMTKEELYDRLVNKFEDVEIDVGDLGITDVSFYDGGRYSNSALVAMFEDDVFSVTMWHYSDDGEETESGSYDFETDSFEELWDELMSYKPEALIECSERKPIPEGMTIEQLVEEMEENEDTVECTQCNELFDKSTCRKELNLGWCCSRCADDLIARGEDPVFKSDNYWDFLDEKLDLDLDFSNCVESSDMEIWGLEHTGENFYKTVLLKRFNDVSFKGPEDEAQKVYDEMYNIDGVLTFSFGKDGLPVLNAWNVNLLRKLGSINIEFEDTRYEDAAAAAWGKTPVREEVEELHDLGNEYDGGYPTEIPEVSDSHLKLCPECGKETFDIETGICVDCGFN